MPKIITDRQIIPVRKIDIALRKPVGTCDDYSFIATSVLRAKGIPVALDYTPQWPFRSMGHSWNVVLDNFGNNVVFLGAQSSPGVPHKEDHPVAKVFRKTYKINREVVRIQAKEQYVPATFRHYCMKDVTGEYVKTYDLEIRPTMKIKSEYAYLAVFDNEKWAPIYWGKVKGAKVKFDKMGSDIVYLPVIYTGEGAVPVSPPFILTPLGEKKELKANLQQRRTMILSRKYPILPHVFLQYKKTIGATIQASESPDFKNAQTLYTVSQPGFSCGNIVLGDSVKAYRYWRYFSPENGYSTVAEIYFFEKGGNEAIYGNVLGTEHTDTDSRNVKELAFDKDPVTYFEAPNPSGGWSEWTSESPCKLKKLSTFHGETGIGSLPAMSMNYCIGTTTSGILLAGRLPPTHN